LILLLISNNTNISTFFTYPITIQFNHLFTYLASLALICIPINSYPKIVPSHSSLFFNPLLFHHIFETLQWRPLALLVDIFSLDRYRDPKEEVLNVVPEHLKQRCFLAVHRGHYEIDLRQLGASAAQHVQDAILVIGLLQKSSQC